MKKIIFIVFLVTALLVCSFFGGSFGITFLERDKPLLKITSLRAASEPLSIEAVFQDSGAGLKEISIVAEQNTQTIELINKKYDALTKEDKIELSLIRFNALKEGPALIKATAKDNSLWGNTHYAELEILIDYSPPRLELLSLQHVASQGGAEFVIYKALDSNLETHGVEVGEYFFPGFPIAETGGIKALPDTYGSLFALPLGYERNRSTLQLRAKDKAGNITVMPLNFRISSTAQRAVDMNMSDDFLQRKNPELFPGYVRFAAQKGEKVPEKEADLPEAAWQFKLINRNYRDLLDAQLDEITKSSDRPRLWKEPFIKPMPSATSSTFGEKRTYLYKGLNIGHSVHNGLDLASVQADAVQAANDGIVVLAEDFGIYGNTILIDHGLGLFSLYGHLSSMAVATNESVSRGQEIGRSGQTGLAGGDHLHFEFRIREVPVTPIEWWDAKWIVDNIDGKIKELTVN